MTCQHITKAPSDLSDQTVRILCGPVLGGAVDLMDGGANPLGESRVDRLGSQGAADDPDHLRLKLLTKLRKGQRIALTRASDQILHGLVGTMHVVFLLLFSGEDSLGSQSPKFHS